MSAKHLHEQLGDAEYWTRRHSEHVVLDIGGDVGALVLYTPPELRGREIEVSLLTPGAPRIHTAVLERWVAGRTIFAAVYPELRAGTYRFWGCGPRPMKTARVVAGRVAEVDWR